MAVTSITWMDDKNLGQVSNPTVGSENIILYWSDVIFAVDAIPIPKFPFFLFGVTHRDED